MKVFKFGGASVKGASGIRNLVKIVAGEEGNLVIVVSAFGKTTNALEIVLKTWLSGEKSYKDHLEAVYLYHLSVSEDLFSGSVPVKKKIDESFNKLKEYLAGTEASDYDFEYDQIVSYGEVWSTIIIAEYLKLTGSKITWIDIRKALLTDKRFRDANVSWEESKDLIKSAFNFEKSTHYITQGFIGGTADGFTTTLGREGSDYTAAILANMLDAESVTVWKDVPGLLNADPKWMPDARKMDEVSYREAVEMTFSGAKVIHPKTIKPLHNKKIPLYVKSFLAPGLAGTLVTSEPEIAKVIPVFIKKENQVLLSLLPRDFSFVMGDNLSMMFRVFTQYGIKVNLVEASAVSIDVCVDDERPKVEALTGFLKNEYSVLYNDKVEMLTIRHYTPESVDRITKSREVLLEQKTRSTVRFVVRMEHPPSPLKGG